MREDDDSFVILRRGSAVGARTDGTMGWSLGSLEMLAVAAAVLLLFVWFYYFLFYYYDAWWIRGTSCMKVCLSVSPRSVLRMIHALYRTCFAMPPRALDAGI